jgi:hypothetical protein
LKVFRLTVEKSTGRLKVTLMGRLMRHTAPLFRLTEVMANCPPPPPPPLHAVSTAPAVSAKDERNRERWPLRMSVILETKG